ncbi:MAG: hypothetical protein JXA49_02715 [Actinobacteria bacterium]|nr:hypothetical protein [Actinomycetota bacterium]
MSSWTKRIRIKIPLISVITAIILLSITVLPHESASAAGPAAYFISTAGSDLNAGTQAAPWSTFAHAFSVMAPGDTLLVGDGTYTERIEDPVSGTPSSYTTIAAERDGGVIIDGSLAGEWESALNIYDGRYIRIEGMKFRGGRADGTGNSAAAVYGSDHIRIMRCAFYDPSLRSREETPGGTNYPTFSISGCSYMLVEDCWAWGYGRYKFESYNSDHVIFRRCLARYDRMKAHYPMAVFSIYGSPYNQMQNCMAIDSDQDEYYTCIDESSEGFYGGLVSPNNSTENNNRGMKILGCMALNVSGDQGCGSLLTYGDQYIKDTVVWDCSGGITYGVPNENASVSAEHLTCGGIYGEQSDYTPSGGNGATCWEDGLGSSITNSLFANNNEYGIFNFRGSDFNDFYGNAAGDYGNSWGQSHTVAGPNDRYLDPEIKYITRIERGSPLKNAASDGGDIGATVLKRYGESGTLYGESGFERLTDRDLWPWPNQYRIQNDMGAYVGPPAGVRGFCAPGTNLTKYVWEYLGNPVPDDLYRQWYFAEGTTRDNGTDGRFEEWICLQNTDDRDAWVTLYYMLSDGSVRVQETCLRPRSRATVSVNEYLGPDRDTSVLVESSARVVAERPMYFNYGGWCTGGHVTAGATEPSKIWYFAEGTTRDNPRDGRFDEWLCLQNPNSTEARVRVSYIFAAGDVVECEHTVPATGRKTLDVEAEVGSERDVSIVVGSDIPIVAERPMYFDYHGKWTGGHVVTGEVSAATRCYFAEGTTRDNPVDGSFEEWICIQNPNDDEACITVICDTDKGASSSTDIRLPPRTRTTLDIRDIAGREVDVSVEMHSSVPVVAERPVYFNYRGHITGGHDSCGVASPARRFYFAEGTTRDGFDTWVTVLNPQDSPVVVSFTYLLEDHELSITETMNAHSRTTRDMRLDAGGGIDASVIVEGDKAIVVERPMYFIYHGWCAGGHDSTGFRDPLE